MRHFTLIEVAKERRLAHAETPPTHQCCGLPI